MEGKKEEREGKGREGKRDEGGSEGTAKEGPGPQIFWPRTSLRIATTTQTDSAKTELTSRYAAVAGAARWQARSIHATISTQMTWFMSRVGRKTLQNLLAKQINAR